MLGKHIITTRGIVALKELEKSQGKHLSWNPVLATLQAIALRLCDILFQTFSKECSVGRLFYMPPLNACENFFLEGSLSLGFIEEWAFQGEISSLK